MPYRARMIEHTIAPNGRELISIEATIPQMVEQEFERHRSFSLSGSSTRAIPLSRQLQMVREDPVMPVSYGRIGKGMQAREELSEVESGYARDIILWLQSQAIYATELLAGERQLVEFFDSPQQEIIKVHKQIAGRYLQPWAWRTYIITGTDWKNFWYLRCHSDAQPEIQPFAFATLKAYLGSTPRKLKDKEWHLPYCHDIRDDSHFSDIEKCFISAARCARVSFLNHPDLSADPDGLLPLTPDPSKDLIKGESFQDGSGGIGHNSPYEHQGQALGLFDQHTRSGNFRGYLQFRKLMPGEDPEDRLTRNDLVKLLDNERYVV